MISGYSVLSSVIFFNLAIVLVAVFRKKTDFLVKYSNDVLVFAAVLGLVRLFLPLDLSFAYVIQSWGIVPLIVSFLNLNLLGGEVYLKLSTALLILWLFAALAILLVQTKKLKSDIKQIKRCKKSENSFIESVFDGMNFKNTRLIISDDISVPMVGGFFKATIYAPNMALSREQWQYVFTHEYCHFKNHDSFIKLFYLALTAIFWWNPLVHKFQRELNRLLELRCDATVCKGLQNAEIVKYLQSILAVAVEIDAPKTGAVFGSALVSGGNDEFLVQRFNVIADGQKSKKSKRALAYVFVVLVFLASYMVILQPASHPKGSEEDVGFVITPENAYIRRLEDGSLQLFADGEFRWDISQGDLTFEPFSNLKIIDGENIK